MAVVYSEKLYAKVLAATRGLADGTSTTLSIYDGKRKINLEPLLVYKTSIDAILKMTRTKVDKDGTQYMVFVLPQKDAVIVAKVNLLIFLAQQAVMPNPNTTMRDLLRTKCSTMLEIPFSKLFPESSGSKYKWEPFHYEALKVKDVLAGPSHQVEKKLQRIMQSKCLSALNNHLFVCLFMHCSNRCSFILLFQNSPVCRKEKRTKNT